MLVDIKQISKIGDYKVWETEVLGRKVEVWQKGTRQPRLMDLALSFALNDNGVSANMFIDSVVNASAGERVVISSIPLSVTMNFCNRKLNASLTTLIGSAHRDLDVFCLRYKNSALNA